MTYQTERLSLKLSSQDKWALRRMAEAEGEAMAVVVRRLIRQATLQSPSDDRQHQKQGGQDE